MIDKWLYKFFEGVDIFFEKIKCDTKVKEDEF